MARQRSNLICKCGRTGGFLTERKAGYGRKNKYYYIGHYDPAKGRTWCSISEHDLAHLEFNDVRYRSEYLPMIVRLRELYKFHAADEEKGAQREKAEVVLLRIFKGKETLATLKPIFIEMVIKKVHADLMEIHIQEMITERKDDGITTDHNVLWRHFHDLPVTPWRLWSNHPHYKNWPKRKTYRKRYQPSVSLTSKR